MSGYDEPLAYVLGGLGILDLIWVLWGVAFAILWLSEKSNRAQGVLWLKTGLVLIGVTAFGIAYKAIESSLEAAPPADRKIEIPAYHYAPWHGLPVQSDGRIKPFETHVAEIVRQITGRERFEKNDPVAVALMWMMLNGTNSGTTFADWEAYPFILCDHHGLRAEIYQEVLEERPDMPAEEREEKRHGKYISPADLRTSKRFFQLQVEAQSLRRKDKDKAVQLMSPEQRKAEEVVQRLSLFDSVSQNNPITLGKRPRQRHEDKTAFVALDKVRGSAWFSIGELKECLESYREREKLPAERRNTVEDKWQALMKERLKDTPQLYISPERQESLGEFQTMVKAGTAQQALDELAALLKERSDKKLKQFDEMREKNDHGALEFVFREILETKEEQQRLVRAAREKGTGASDEVRAILYDRDKAIIGDLQQRVQNARAEGYHPDDPKFRMLHLNYMENRYPDLYPQSAAWQTFPFQDVERVLASYSKAQDAYKSGDADRFDGASQEFFTTVRDVSQKYGPYPGEDTVGDRLAGLLTGRIPSAPSEDLLRLEQDYNRVQPFGWAWKVMLLSMLLFIVSLAVKSRAFYLLGFAAFVGSLGFQVYGYYVRMSISARPPVSNIYETVVWVSFMSAIFALILELVYRRTVIVLSGAMVATIGLVLADQLPLVLDPGIKPLVAVLRSNYWLFIHVLTEVSSYAAGAVAWALGNVALVLIAFGKPRRDAVKMLSQFTYRGIQIAVLLLAAGTFLGGWWAAESWGRFWGWDPKETWAFISLLCYVIPLHARYVGWVKDFGLAVSAVICFGAIMMSWYGVNFVLGTGLHSYGFGAGSPWWILGATLINIEVVLAASLVYMKRQAPETVPVAAA